MTIRMLIKELLIYPNLDAQVVDTDGSPIMYTQYHSARESDNVRLEPKSQMDTYEELDALFANALEEGRGDRDVLDELFERGYTLDDLKDYREDTYQWALNILKE